MYRRITPLVRNGRLQSLKTPSFQRMGLTFPKAVGTVSVRTFSSEAPKEGAQEGAKTSNSTRTDMMKYDSDEYDDYEPQTKQEKVKYYGALFMRLLFLATGLGLAAFTVSELFPGRMSAQHIFSEVFDLLQMNDQVCCYISTTFVP